MNDFSNCQAVIDLGTNTFHLLIAYKNEAGELVEVYRERIFVWIGREGMSRIGDASFQKGVEAMQKFSNRIAAYNIHKNIKAFGTAALRTASNGQDFLTSVYEKTGIQVQLISGDEEALLIHKGVTKAVPMHQSNSLIMDIGGGSVEFIICNKDEVFWYQSFPIGVSVLYNHYHKNDPISDDEIKTLTLFLKEQLSPLIKALEKFTSKHLIGASGTFDTVEDILEIQKFATYSEVPIDGFFQTYTMLINTKIEERRQMPVIPDERIEMIIVAMILINTVLEIANIETISVSAYALKEGMLLDSLQA